MTEEFVHLADGRDVPRVAVDALHMYDAKVWPGATNRVARAGIVAAVMEALRAGGYVIAKGISEETQAIPVSVVDSPERLIPRGFDMVPARHVEFIPHSRLKTVWDSDECPDCAEEHGVHDRRQAEMQAATNESQSSRQPRRHPGPRNPQESNHDRR